MKKLYFKSIFILFMVFCSLSVTYSVEDDKLNFKYLNLYLDNLSQTNKVSYEISYLSDETLNFELKTKYEGSNLEDVCKYKLDAVSSFRYLKVTCEVEKMGDGVYEFEAIITNSLGEKLTEIVYNKEYIYGAATVGMDFIFDETTTTTTVVLNVRGDGTNLILNHEIPKSVIESLTLENRDSLIKSNKEYVIIKEDPLIAWSVDAPPADINYTIKKKISPEQAREFQVDLTNSSSFKFAKYLITILLLVVLFVIFKPVFFKNKSK